MYNTPVVKDGMLYGLTSGNELYCIDIKTGKTAWSAPVAAAATGAPATPPAAGGGGAGGGQRRGGGGMRGGGGYGSIVDAGSVLLALTPSSQLVVYKPDPKAFEPVARIKVAGSPTYAYPVLSGNRLFVKDKDSVALLTIP